MSLRNLMMGGGTQCLPSEETVLWEIDVYNQELTSITIPNGVKVLKVEMFVLEDSGEQWAAASLYSYDTADTGNYKTWLDVNLEYGGETDEVRYIGVTPSKTYNLLANIGYEVGAMATITISYSASINQQTPKVTDY